MKKLVLISLWACFAAALACLSPEANREADGSSPTIRIAVVPFPLASGTPEPSIDVAEIIRTDLASTGRFAPTTSKNLPSRPAGLSEIRFAEWRTADTDFVVVGLVAIVHDGGHEVEFRVVDTRKEMSIVGFVVPSGPDELETTARKIARIIDQRLTTSRGSLVSSGG